MTARHYVGLAAALSSILLIMGVLINGSNADTEREDAVLTALGDYEQAQAALQRDVVSARVGLLRNYDRLVTDVAELDQASRLLRASAEAFPQARPAVTDLAHSAEVQAQLTENIKSNSALLQNSLAFFSIMARSVATGRSNDKVDALTAAMLRLTLDTSPETQDLVRGRLDAAQAAGGDREPVRVLLAHARVLQRHLPQADRAVRDLLASDSAERRRALRAYITEQRTLAEARAKRFRLALFATSTALVALLVHLGLRLSSHISQLGRRARLEHIVAEVSASLIRASPVTVDATVVEALGRIAEALEADRAYLVGQGPYAVGHIWTRAGVDLESEWPKAALSPDFAPKDQGTLHVEAAARPTAFERAFLDRAGARALGLVWATNEEGCLVLLGFDSKLGRLRLDESELEVVRLALDAIAGAVRRLALERSRVELERRLQLAGRLEAIGVFASGIAHNFNNILGGIGGYAEMAGARARPGSSTARQLGEIQRAVVRGRDLVDGILAFGRRRIEPRRDVSVAELMREGASVLSAGHPAEARFVLATPSDDLGVVLGDGGDLQQVLLNLGGNAIRAMDGRGEVRMSAEPVLLAHSRDCVTGTLPPGAYVRLIVEDSGCGIDPSAAAQIFDPFFTTRRDGHGLGLATAREIVRDHGGSIDVASTPGLGSRFEVWLPQAQPSTEADPTAQGGRSLLLLCATHDSVLESEDLLAALSYEPVGYANEEEAVRAVTTTPERFAAAVCCHPRASIAADWAARLRRASPSLPLVLVSNPSSQLNSDAAALGRCAVAPWPPRSIGLARALSQLPAR